MLALIRSISSICQKRGTVGVTSQFKEKEKKKKANSSLETKFQEWWCQHLDSNYLCKNKGWDIQNQLLKGLLLHNPPLKVSHFIYAFLPFRHVLTIYSEDKRWNLKLFDTKRIQRHKKRSFLAKTVVSAGLLHRRYLRETKRNLLSIFAMCTTFIFSTFPKTKSIYSNMKAIGSLNKWTNLGMDKPNVPSGLLNTHHLFNCSALLGSSCSAPAPSTKFHPVYDSHSVTTHWWP